MAEAALTYIEPPVPHDRVIAYVISGKITTEDMREVMGRIEAIHARGEKALLLQELRGFPSAELAAIVEKMKHMKTLWHGIDRVAMVSDSKLYRSLGGTLADVLTPMTVRSFEPNDRDAAFAWLVEPAAAD